MTRRKKSWNEANKDYLMASLQAVREELEGYQSHLKGTAVVSRKTSSKNIESVKKSLPFPSALERLVSTFHLSEFERKILLVCAGCELDTNFHQLVSSLQGNSPYPSFGLALAAFPEAHWSAMAPTAPLRHWQLLNLNPEEHITKSPLKLDEFILHYLTGVSYLDERLKAILNLVHPEKSLVSSQTKNVNEILNTFSTQEENSSWPMIHLLGENASDKQAIAAYAAEKMGLNLYSLSIDFLQGNTSSISDLTRLWDREAALNSCALYIDCTQLDLNDKPKVQLISHFIEQVQGIIFLGTEEWMPKTKQTKKDFNIEKPTQEEQLQLWKKGLGKRGSRLKKPLEKIVGHFNLSAYTIADTSKYVLDNLPSKNGKAVGISPAIWNACCLHTRPKVDELAQRIEPIATWEDIVLPENQEQLLREIAMQVKNRSKVYEEWGFATKGDRGLGISALFTGESGTGKTMASEVLANELQLDLFRIDLSQVVNKYIGETEKNLKRIFDAAEEGGAILLFDEADALFGKRSDVKDSHDRYSNIEVSYLLQRMEAYRGLAILTTNLKSAIDKAFLRRIRFVVPFPYPNTTQRAEIWRRIFPADMPQKNLDFSKLSRLSVPGGNIRNIALNAAFMAAGQDEPVQMQHILRAVRAEYDKLEKNLSNAEIAGWS